jgi:small subunit ribosomal protein S2
MQKEESKTLQIPEIDLKKLLEAGVHFGHRTARWNPKMKPYIYTSRNDIHIIDLEATQKELLKALKLVAQVAQKGGVILLAGTKKQAKKVVQKAAEDCAMPYIVNRWLGGTFTNFTSISKRLEYFKNLEDKVKSTEFKKRYTKKEQAGFKKELADLEYKMGGIKKLKKIPDLIFIIDINQDKLAVKEAQQAKVKSIALADSNTDPSKVDLAIPSNDDAVKAIELMANFVSETILKNKK